MKDYCDSMLLQPPSHGFFRPFLKSVHVLEQKEVMPRALGPSPLSHTRTLALIGKGLSSSWNVGCHARATREEDPKFVLT